MSRAVFIVLLSAFAAALMPELGAAILFTLFTAGDVRFS